MRKVLLFYGSYGGGHLSAAKSLKEYIEKKYPDIQVNMIDCIEYINKILNKLTTKVYSEMAKKAPWAWKKVYYSSEKGILSKVSNLSNKLMSSKLNKCISDFNPDIIISTHPFSSQMCTILKKQGKIKCKISTVLTDLHIHNQWLVGADQMDYYFVANNKMKEDMCNKGIDEFKIFVTGIPFSQRFLQKYDKNYIIKKFNLTPNKFTILFFAGGEFGLGKTKTFEIFKTLVTNFSDVQIIAIAGRNVEMKNLFTNFVAENGKKDSVCVLEYTNQVPELMSISNFVVTKPGGLTTTESLVSGLPMLIINPIPGQEEQNAEFLEQSGVAVWLKKDDDIKNILLNLLSSKEKIKRMRDNALTLAKPNSVDDICRILFEV